MLPQQVADGALKSNRKAFYVVKRDVLFATFNCTDVSAMNPDESSKSFLREPQLLSPPSQVFSKDVPGRPHFAIYIHGKIIAGRLS